jgi:hypothetical protein
MYFSYTHTLLEPSEQLFKHRVTPHRNVARTRAHTHTHIYVQYQHNRFSGY